MNSKLLASLFGISILLSAPSLVRIPLVLPFFHADVRAAAPETVGALREQGLWLVNVDLQNIERKENEVCFHWEHRYTSRTTTSNPHVLTTCL